MTTSFLTNKLARSLFTTAFPITFLLVAMILLLSSSTNAQRRHAPGAGHRAVVVDERLAALREKPSLFAPLSKRLSRGRLVSILNSKRSPEGVIFYRVAVTRRTRGWLQSEAVVSSTRIGDDERLLNLIRASKDFDRIARASLFLEAFRGSIKRPAVLLMLATTAEDAARKLSAEAARRLDEVEMKATRASMFSYFMNFSGLDRYHRIGVEFVFDEASKNYHYNGAALREIARRYPKSAEAIEARRRLAGLRVDEQNKM